MGEATVSLPGGCAIGDRPIDLHLKALECLGAKIELTAGYVKASAPKGRLPGGDFSFPIVSVGATENAVMAAVLAKGRIAIVQRRARAGDRRSVQSAGRDGREDRGNRIGHLIIDGVEALHGTTYEVMPDRIEAGSYACAAGITGGSLDLIGARPDEMRATLNALAQAGLTIEFHDQRHQGQRQRRLEAAGAVDRAVSRASRPTCRRSSWRCSAVAQGRQLPRGDDLREPLHARARASPDGRRRRHPWPLGDRSRSRRR